MVRLMFQTLQLVTRLARSSPSSGGIHVTAFGSEPNSGARPATEDSTVQVPDTELPNTGITLSSTVNRVQGHACTKAYCLRINKASKQEECRFLLHDALRNKPKVDRHPTRSIFPRAQRCLPEQVQWVDNNGLTS
jgi:hypothetical protein